jgi:hypothetical protein
MKAWLLLFALVPFRPASSMEPAPPPGDPSGEVARLMRAPRYHRWELRLEPGEREEEGWRLERPPWLERWAEVLREAWEWLRTRAVDLLGRRAQEVKPAPERGGAFQLTLWQATGYALLSALTVFLALAAYNYFKHGRSRRRAAPLTAAAVRRALDRGEALAMEAPGWLAEADRLGDEGDPRRAYRALYLGLLSALHARGRIVFSRHRTNGYYVRHFRGDEPPRREFAALTDVFDRVWYGLSRAPLEGRLDELGTRVRTLAENA